MRGKTKQLELRYRRKRTWGGKRANAGRKPAKGRRRVRHRTRQPLASRFPVHVTVRVLDGLPRLRGFRAARVLRKAFVRGCNRSNEAGTFRICQFSVQGNHVHLICEAQSAAALSRGIQGWKIRVARSMNRHWKRSGSVWSDRFHVRIMKTPTQVRNALCYVLHNARRHGERLPAWAGGVDPFSSAWHFDGWTTEVWRHDWLPPPDNNDGVPVAPARTWLLTDGWSIGGPLSPQSPPP